ncbi:cystatin-like [Mixophyes fleayi]|uniref:cystatin-like n=1 Tax=Mixophyes fleayi TaxID=3061075 RepID=UPI003F4D9DEA
MAKLCIVAAVLAFLIAVAQADNLLGGLIEANENEDGVQHALAFAMKEYNRGSNDMYMSRVNKVQRAQRKMISGIFYNLNVEIGRTQCRKPTTDISNCALHPDPNFTKSKLCHFEVMTVPWRATTEMLKMECN